MIKNFLQKFFCYHVYQPKSKDWYQEKGYKGKDHHERFADFLAKQKKHSAIFYHEFKGLSLQRQFIPSGEYLLDAIIILPEVDCHSREGGNPAIFQHFLDPRLRGNDMNRLYIIFFHGKSEYYELRFRDMARECRETGATVIGFNPKGMGGSGGRTRVLNDIVQDGIAVINYLLSNNISPDKIILQGNSLGAAAGEMVSQHFIKQNGFGFRQINSNSFKSVGAVIAHYYHLPFLEKILEKIVKYSGWEIEVEKDYYTTGPHRCYLRRFNDRTILPRAQYHSMVDHERDHGRCPDYFKETLAWLNSHNLLIYIGDNTKDSHEMSLHHFKVKPLPDDQDSFTVYQFINRFIKG